jgi:hypothetical protein
MEECGDQETYAADVEKDNSILMILMQDMQRHAKAEQAACWTAVMSQCPRTSHVAAISCAQTLAALV